MYHFWLVHLVVPCFITVLCVSFILEKCRACDTDVNNETNISENLGLVRTPEESKRTVILTQKCVGQSEDINTEGEMIIVNCQCFAVCLRIYMFQIDFNSILKNGSI